MFRGERRTQQNSIVRVFLIQVGCNDSFCHCRRRRRLLRHIFLILYNCCCLHVCGILRTFRTSLILVIDQTNRAIGRLTFRLEDTIQLKLDRTSRRRLGFQNSSTRNANLVRLKFTDQTNLQFLFMCFDQQILDDFI